MVIAAVVIVPPRRVRLRGARQRAGDRERAIVERVVGVQRERRAHCVIERDRSRNRDVVPGDVTGDDVAAERGRRGRQGDRRDLIPAADGTYAECRRAGIERHRLERRAAHAARGGNRATGRIDRQVGAIGQPQRTGGEGHRVGRAGERGRRAGGHEQGIADRRRVGLRIRVVDGADERDRPDVRTGGGRCHGRDAADTRARRTKIGEADVVARDRQSGERIGGARRSTNRDVARSAGERERACGGHVPVHRAEQLNRAARTGRPTRPARG